jgi:Tol biopolymer transport system component
MMDANGTNQWAMEATEEYEINPEGIPSGQIFFTADYRGDPEIYSVFTTGFNPTKWTISPGMDVITDVGWGGFPILFWSQRDPVEGFEGPPPEIYMMNMAAEETRLTNNTTSDTCAAWSADMSQIGYSSYRYDYQSVRIVVMNADGSDSQDLIDTPANDYCPQWSPDGGSIAFYTDDPACFPAQCGELWLMDPDGTDAHPLDIFEGPAVFRDVSWSPHGEWLVFSADVGAGFDVYLVRPDGTDLMNLTQDSPGNDWEADWYTRR